MHGGERRAKVSVKNGKLSLQTPPQVAHASTPGPKEEEKVGENNGQLRLIRHHRWRTQARLDQNQTHIKGLGLVLVATTKRWQKEILSKIFLIFFRW